MSSRKKQPKSKKQVRDALGQKTKRKKRKDAKPKKKKKKKKKKEDDRTLDAWSGIILSDKNPNPKDLKQFFCLAVSLKGTTPAIIKAKSLKQAHFIYTRNVVIPANPKNQKVFKPSRVKKGGRVYFDEDCYIERMKLWKKYKGYYPICALAADIKVIKFRFSEDQFDRDLQGDDD